MAVPAHDERDFAFALKFGLPILPVIERPDGLTKSFVRAGSVRNGFENALEAEGFRFASFSDGWGVTLGAMQVEIYSSILRNFLKPNVWAEIVGTGWCFISNHATMAWDSVEAEREILKRCQEIDPASKPYRTLMEMLWSNEWYRDALYHDQYGMMIYSGDLTGTTGESAKREVTSWLAERQFGQGTVNYRLRDWLISRQRYWGAPIPIVYCPEHGAVPVPDEQLPVLLPDDVEWRPTGESPLKLHPTWKQTICPLCGQPAERETDTMDTFMCSSWYHLRYLSPDYADGPYSPQEYDYWMPVDTYTGGIEHATMHLIYTRFFHKAGRDMGIMTGSEPMTQLRNQGIILGEDYEKMSKSRGNVVSPDALVNRYGADTVRAYLMFFARWEMGGPWNSSGIEGSARWVRRVWSLFTESAMKGTPTDQQRRDLRRKVHQTLKIVTNDYTKFEFNTVISALMELLNELYKYRDLGLEGSPEWAEALDIYLRMMAPSCPHIAEELWARLKKPYSIHQQSWPEYDEAAAAEEQITLVLQINGKLRDRILVPADISDEEAKEFALTSDVVKKHLEGKTPRKVILVPGKLVNIVI